MIKTTPATDDRSPRPIRVLHVLGGTGCGGTETWLAALLNQSDDTTQSDILVHSEARGHYDSVFRKRGAKILTCHSPRQPLKYARNFRNIVRQHGPYDIVHSHVALFSGYVLRLAHREQIPIRIAHSHCARVSTTESTARFGRNFYSASMKRWISRYATHRIAASPIAIQALDSPGAGGPTWNVLPCGIDTTGFDGGFDGDNESGELRASLGIDDSRLVLGHVGRFIDAKNHRFLLQVIASLKAIGIPCLALLVGDGELRESTKQLADELGIDKDLMFLGTRSDVPAILNEAVDIFVFPSKHEGLGLSVVEAQAAGLPCFVSANVPMEATVIPQLVHRLQLSDGPEAWAQAIKSNRSEPSCRIEKHRAIELVAASDFGISQSADGLRSLYHGALAGQNESRNSRGRAAA